MKFSSSRVFPDELPLSEADRLDGNLTSQKLLMVCDMSVMNPSLSNIAAANKLDELEHDHDISIHDNTLDQVHFLKVNTRNHDKNDSVLQSPIGNKFQKEKKSSEARTPTGDTRSGAILAIANDECDEFQKEQGGIVFDFTKKRFRIVKRFVNKIKMFSPTLKFVNSTKKQLANINDPSFYWDILFRQGIFHNEDSLLRRVWDTIQFMTLLANLIYLPVYLSFLSSEDSSNLIFLICEIIPNLVQILNILLEFNTGFYQHGIVIIDRKAIFMHYVKRKFVFDVLLSISWVISLDDEASSWFKVALLLRMLVLIRLIRSIEETFSFRESLGSYFELAKLSGFIFISAHFCGCVWYALGAWEKEIGVEKTWLDRDSVNFSESELNPKYNAYIAAFYWSIVTMCTVGYGDITPATYRERIFTIFTVLASSFVFGFSMNQIGQIIENMRSQEEQMKNTIATLNVYMKKRGLKKEMQLKVRRYYEYMFLEKQNDNEKGRDLIDDLTPCLREEVHRDIYTAMFSDEKIFAKNFSESFLLKLYRIVDEISCRAEENLFFEGEHSEKLFFILKGQGNQVITELNAGTFVGSVEFFSDRTYTFSAKTTQPTQIAVIPRKDFVELLLEGRREDFESFMEIKDRILFYQDPSRINQSCESCGNPEHIFDNCTWIKFHANKHKQIYQFTSLKQITRQKWPRHETKTSSLLECQETEKSVKQYRVDNHINVEDEQKDKKQLTGHSVLSPVSQFLGTIDSPRIVQGSQFLRNHKKSTDEEKNCAGDPPVADASQQKSRWLDSMRKRNKTRHSTTIAVVVRSDSETEASVTQAKGIDGTNSIHFVENEAIVVDIMEGQFEQMHEFSKYFVKNNCSVVLKKVNKMIQKGAVYNEQLKGRKNKKKVKKQENDERKKKKVILVEGEWDREQSHDNHSEKRVTLKDPKQFPIRGRSHDKPLKFMRKLPPLMQGESMSKNVRNQGNGH